MFQDRSDYQNLPELAISTGNKTETQQRVSNEIFYIGKSLLLSPYVKNWSNWEAHWITII